MKRILFFSVMTLLMCGMYSCKSSQKYQKPDTGKIGPAVQNYRTTGDWAGTYFGTVPCADCPGITTELTLNTDLSYTLTRTYIDRKGTALSSGNFTWNSAGTQIDLKDVKEYGAFEHFLVQDNQLILLSMTGEIMGGVDISDYTLTKVSTTSSASGLTNKYWKLVELMGEPVIYPEGAANEAYISFKPDGSVNGNLGCNSFSGAYSVPQATRISFSKMVNTQKMCMDMNIETKLLKVLQTADNYNLNGNQLVLNRARMAPLARFEVVYM